MFQNELCGAWDQKYRLRRSDNCFLWLLLANSGFGWFSLHLMTLRTPSELRKVSISYDHWADLKRVVKLCQNSFFSFRNFFDLVDFRAFWVVSGPPESPGVVFASKTDLRAHQIRKQLQNGLKISYQWNFGGIICIVWKTELIFHSTELRYDRPQSLLWLPRRGSAVVDHRSAAIQFCA